MIMQQGAFTDDITNSQTFFYENNQNSSKVYKFNHWATEKKYQKKKNFSPWHYGLMLI